MNILNTINNSCKKIIKGFFAIFVFKLLLFGSIFIVQSCQNTDEIFEPEIAQALKRFENSVLKAKSNIQVLIGNVKTQKTGNINKVSLYNKVPIEEVGSIEEVEMLNEIEAENAINHLTNESIHLFSTYGITENDLENELVDLDGSEIIEYGILMLAAATELEEENNELTISFNDLFISNSLYASRIGECAGDALGISAIAAVIQGGLHTSTAKKLLFKALRKVASRTLGWVGAAIFVYEFGDCMDWWASGNPIYSNSELRECTDLVKVNLDPNYYVGITYVYISKYDIEYVSDTNFNISSVSQYDTYKLLFSGEIGSNCTFEKLPFKVLGNKIIASSVELYIPLINDDDF